MCGIIGVFDRDGFRNVMPLTHKGLKASNHRGELQWGMVNWTRERLGKAFTGEGKVDPDMSAVMSALGESPLALGAVRYATVGGTDLRCAQPVHAVSKDMKSHISLVLNGTINNFEPTGECPVDTLKIAQALADLKQHMSVQEALAEMEEELDGAWSIIFFDEKGDMYAYRNSTGNRPLSYAEWDGKLVVASEDVAMHAIHPSIQARDVPAGQMIHIRRPTGNIRSLPVVNSNEHFCFFEWVYFANYLSTLRGQNVAEFREHCGEHLARMDAHMGFKRDDTVVVPIPKSARKAAFAYSLTYNDGDGLPYVEAIRKHGDSRLFISPGSNGNRDKLTEERFTIAPEMIPMIRGKKVILVEDSLVRGTTIQKAQLVQKLREAGAIEVHFRLACPPIFYTCNYGIDMPTIGELMAPRHSDGTLLPDGTMPEANRMSIAGELGMDSVVYLPVDAVLDISGMARERVCLACVTGKNPTPGGQKRTEHAMAQIGTLKPTR